MARTGLSLSRALAEFTVIVTGVLVALAADAWNDGRLDRAEERDYLLRFHNEVVTDTMRFRTILDGMDRKEAALSRLRDLIGASGAAAPSEEIFAADLAAASNFGWNVGPLAGRSTFDELRSSGNLGLIRNTGLRTRLIDYYASAEAEDRRIQARRTEFPHIAYRLVPSSTRADSSQFGASERVELEDPAGLLATLRTSSLPDYILAEKNRARFIRTSVTGLRQEALKLLEALAGEPSGPI